MLHSIYQSPIGTLYFWFEDEKLVYASFDEEHGKGWVSKRIPDKTARMGTLPAELERALAAYFSGRKVDWTFPLKLYGTPFQVIVWREIQNIKHGEVSTYKQIGAAINSKAYRAIGQAVGANPISVIIPCHRVLGTNWLGGYGGGINRKRLLLELENVSLAPNFFA